MKIWRAMRDRLLAMASRFGDSLRRRFVDAVYQIRSDVDLQRLESALEQRDLDSAMNVVAPDPAAMTPASEELRTAYIETGTVLATAVSPSLRRGRLPLRFDIRRDAAAQWIRDSSLGLLTAVTEDQREIIRELLFSSVQDGRRPRTMALDLVGRVNALTGRREGGVLGLSLPYARAVERARRELTSGTDDLGAYLRRTRRDRRFDALVEGAIERGERLSRSDVDKIVGRYSERLLESRGQLVAQNEIAEAMRAAEREVVEQLIEREGIAPGRVYKIWKSRRDERTRNSHEKIHNTRRRLDERFDNGLLHPHEVGAPAREKVGCRCRVEYEVE